jgi:hypothetical protein
MEGIPVLREQIEHYDLMCKIDLKDAYVILGLKEVQETRNNNNNMQRIIRNQNQQTILRINEITNNEIVKLAEKAHVTSILEWVSINSSSTNSVPKNTSLIL